MSDQQNTTREHRLIAKIKEWTGEQLIGDDCAVLPGGMLVTADTLVQNTHFIIPGITYADLGWKSVAVNLSDIAAMCGRPRFAIVNLTLPPSVGEADIENLFAGMIDCARNYRCRIVGGDLTRGEIIVITITLIGDVHENGVGLRSGALPGDIVICSGDFGASAAGLWLMKDKSSGFEYCATRHFRPIPRLCEAWSLIRLTKARAAVMDASDGLADALVQIAHESGVGLDVDEQEVPVHAETRAVANLAGINVMDWALYGGEDYELVATIAPVHWDALQKSEHNAFKRIGTVTDAHAEVLLRRPECEPQPIMLEKTFQHWS